MNKKSVIIISILVVVGVLIALSSDYPNEKWKDVENIDESQYLTY